MNKCIIHTWPQPQLEPQTERLMLEHVEPLRSACFEVVFNWENARDQTWFPRRFQGVHPCDWKSWKDIFGQRFMVSSTYRN